MRKFLALLPWIVVLLGGASLYMKSRPAQDQAGDFQINRFGRLPVVYQGRVKPFDTLARNSMTILSRRQTYTDMQGKSQPAVRWLLEVLSATETSFNLKVFRIENLDVLSSLGLEQRDGFRYSFNEFRKKIEKLEEESNRARELNSAERSIFDIKVLELADMVHLFTRLIESHSIPVIEKKEDLLTTIERLKYLDNFPMPHSVPPYGELRQWMPLNKALFREMASSLMENMTVDKNPFAMRLNQMLAAYQQNKPEDFNKAMAEYEALLAANPPPKSSHMAAEANFNHFEPFYQTAVVYVFVFILSLLSFLSLSASERVSGTLRRTAFWLCLVALLVHTWALYTRMSLSGYPPVTNLYSSAIFIGWGAVCLGLLLEGIYKIGIGNLIAATTGFLTLLIAHFLAGDGDTLEMMQAVLDTKFWLATHVTTITLGYTATFLAGFIALCYVFSGLFTGFLNAQTNRVMGQMMYGILCLALLLSFTGTVLGGLWADDSWGRFWGWDPKENGALIIVLWVALVLHARWGGMIQTRGMAALSIFGNIVTAWSWFGVNQLGVGLHSYGFLDGAKLWLSIFVVFNLMVILLSLVPQKFWRSSPTSAG